MHRHTKLAQFSIRSVHFTAFPCSLSLLVLAALHLRAGAGRVLPKGGRGLGFAPIRGLGMGLGRGLGWRFGRGLRWGTHLHGGRLRGGFGLGLGGLLSLKLGVRLCELGARLSQRVTVRFGVRLLFGLGGLLRCSNAPNGSLLKHGRHTTDASQHETSPFPPGVPPTVSPPHNRGDNPRVDTFGVGHKNPCTKQGVGWLIRLQRGGSSRRFYCCCCFPFTSFPFPRGGASSNNDELLLGSKDLRLSAGRFLGLVGLGWGALGGGGGGLCWGGAAGAGGRQPTTGQ